MKVLLIVFCLFLCTTYLKANKINLLLKELDESISKRAYYQKEKETKLLKLKSGLDKATDKRDQYILVKQIMEEYSYFISDSAIFYSNKSLELATELKNKDYELDAKLSRAYLLCFPELFSESFKIMESINPENLPNNYKCKYYATYIHLYHNQIKDLNDSFYRHKYRREQMKYVDMYLSIGDKNNVEYLTVLAYKYYQNGDVPESVNIINKILESPNLSPYLYAEFLYNMGGVYLESGKELFKAKEFLLRASIEYNKLSIKKNPALVYLAILLIEDGDVDRAYNYINIAMADVEQFSNKHRKSTTVKAYSTVQNTYLAKIEDQQSVLRNYSILQTILFFIVIIGFFFILRQMKMIKKRKAEVLEINKKLRENNHIKEVYIGHYLNQYSTNISRFEEYKKLIFRKINSGQLEDLAKSEIKSSIKSKKEIENLFSEFDKTFLDLYPNFIENVNGLLASENRYSLKKNQDNILRLNTEIRILALLRLGITENKDIALFLRVTVQTVYNYRSKIKSKAIRENTFEEDVKKISI